MLSSNLTIGASLAALRQHLKDENVEFMQFAFRWMNCLLMREISVQNTIRMWDTYLVGSLLFILKSSSLLTDRTFHFYFYRLRVQMPSRNFISMFVRPFL